MIARSLLTFLLLVLLPDLYVDSHFLRRPGVALWKRCLWWVPAGVLVCYTLVLALQDDFIPRDRFWVDLYLWLLCLAVIPKAVFALCSLVGSLTVRPFQTARNYGHWVGILLGVLAACSCVYGFTFGFNKLEVRRLDLTFDDLPAGFDGYRIAHVSDLHVGTTAGWRRGLLERAVDSVVQARPHVVCFTGDLQNVRPEEALPVKELLRRLPRTFSVLGNHDYSEYADGTADEREALERRMVDLQRRQLGWTLLCNDHCVVKAPGGDSIFIAGTENDGRPPFPKKADYAKALAGVPVGAFVLMMQHDPSAWRRSILTLDHPPQLTLSGHTHGGQVSLFGLRPTMIQYTEDSGLYEDHGHLLNVSNGLGGLIPFRLGVSSEIIIITLHTKAKK